MNILRLIPRAGTAAVLLFAIGCSGGGGGGELTVSEQNAEALAAQGVGAVTMLEGMSEMTDMFSGMFFEGDPGAQMTACPGGGSGVLALNDVVPVGLSAGDYANVAFNGCVIDDSGPTINGTFYLRADDVLGTDPLAGPFTREFYASYDAMTIVVLGATISLDGGLSASLETVDGETYVVTVSGNSFRAFAQAEGMVFSGALTNFMSERTYNETTGAYSVEFEGTVYANVLGGSAHFETTVPFTGTSPDHPSAGTLVATGALGGTVTLIAINSTDVVILVDVDGDGVADGAPINTTWDELENNS